MKRSLILAAAIATLVAPFGAAAHKQWIIPSQAVVNGSDVWVTFDGAVSNQLFFPSCSFLTMCRCGWTTSPSPRPMAARWS